MCHRQGNFLLVCVCVLCIVWGTSELRESGVGLKYEQFGIVSRKEMRIDWILLELIEN